MHDCDEGSPHVIFHMLLCAAIRCKLISAEQIQRCLHDFKWGKADSENRVTKLNIDALVGNWLDVDYKTGLTKSKKTSLGLKAAQFYVIIRLFPAIIPPSEFDRSSSVWACISRLRSIVMFLHSNKFTDIQLDKCTRLYESFLDMALPICGAKVTIKTHNIIHYLDLIIRNMGPAIQRSSYPLERSLGQVSRLAKSLNNYINLPKSCAVRFMQRHSIRLANGFGDPDKYTDLGKCSTHLPDDLINQMPADDQECLEGARLSREFRLRGTTYKSGCYMMMGWEGAVPEIAEIIGYIINNNSTELDDRVLMRVIATIAPREDCTSSFLVNPQMTSCMKLIDLRECGEYYHPFSIYKSFSKSGECDQSVYFHSDSEWISQSV